MARINGTAAVAPTYQVFLAEMFEDVCDHDLCLFISACRSWALEPSLNPSLANAADVAGRMAEAELTQREDEQARVLAEIAAEREAMAVLHAEQAAHDAEAMALWHQRISVGECPF